MGEVATEPLPPRVSAPLQSGEIKSQVAHNGARWLHDPLRLVNPLRFRAGDRIRSGQQVDKVAA